MEFVLISAGTFRMGDRRDDENPRVNVTITKPFYIGKYEVTQAEWVSVMGENPSFFNKCGEECPVENVSWDDAAVFIEKLNDGLETPLYRFPTEAEWEYAARGGLKGQAQYGKINDIAWTRKNAGNKTHPVGQKEPNGFGLHDTLGNVAEWVQDWYARYPSKNLIDPVGPLEGKFRVRRGGCGIGSRGGLLGRLGSSATRCRVGYRGAAQELSSDSGPGAVTIGVSIRSTPPQEDKGVGFRLARSASNPQ
ncbi:MAG: formylglycine-generating enzyme family protein [Rhodospirillaceae bacterium]|nr:formylglycine-generating enzyme family protein [Rhodospirillaceae bacterium]